MLPSLSGLRLSSPDVLRHQPGPSDSPSLRDCSIAVDPFGSSLNSSISVNPVVCLTCGGYISQYSELNPDGEWRCALCLSTNPRFLSSSELQSLRAPRALRQIFPELQGDHYDCVERFASPPKTKHFLFALDAPLCADVDTLDLLLHAVALLPGETMVGVMVFGRHIDLLRLGGMGTEGLASDVFPGDLDSSQKFAHMRHVYFAPARVVRSRWACVAGALSLLSVAPTRHPRAVSGPPLNRSGTSVEALVGLAVTMGGSGAGMGARVRLCILTCRALAAYNPFAGRAPFVSDEGDIRLACFRSIGRWAYAQGCSVDLFYASLGAGNFDQMDALTSASGGVVAAGSAFDEAHLRLSMQTFVRRNSSDVEHMSTLEVRCGGVQVERIVGPLLSAQDVLYHRGTTDTEGMLAVNRRHVANSVAAQCGEGSEMEEHVGRIAKHSVDLCGVNVRGDSGAFVTVTVRPTSTPTTADQAHVQIVARFVRTNAGEMELVTRVWSVRLGFTQDVPRFIAQLDAPLWVLSAARGIVADYHAEMSASDASKGLPTTSIKCTYIALIDDTVRAVAQILTNHHPTQRGGILQALRMLYHLREGPLLDGPAVPTLEAYLLRTAFLRGCYSQCMRLLMPSLLLVSFERQGQAEGAPVPTLTPASAPTVPTAPTPVGLCPAPTLEQLYPPPEQLPLEQLYPPPPRPPTGSAPPPSQPAHVPTPAPVPVSAPAPVGREYPPESTSLLPGTVALIDLGDRILVRVNSPHTQEQESGNPELLSGVSGVSGEAQVAQLHAWALRLAAQRSPASSVCTLLRPGTPQDRLLYSRLSPSHNETRDSLLAHSRYPPVGAYSAQPQPSQPPLPPPSEAQLDLMLQFAPYTEQTSFAAYLLSTLPPNHPLAHVDIKTGNTGINAGYGHARDSGQDPLLIPLANIMDRGPITGIFPVFAGVPQEP